jgi:adenylate cyclase
LLYEFENFTLDTDRRELVRAADLVPLEPKVFDLLVYLIRNHERVVSKDDLISSVWDGRIVSESTMTACINGARCAIGDSGEKQRLIKTLPRKGVRFVGLVQEARPAKQSVFSDKPSIAVLPFQVMGQDVELEAFADGWTEDIITELSRIRGIWVIARNTMFTYKGRAIDVRSVAKELGVHYVLEGSVRKSHGRLRTTAQLIEGETGHHVWATRFDRADTDLFDLQDDLTQCLVASLQTQLVVSQGSAVTRKSHQLSEIGDLLARANARLYQPSADRLSELVSLAEKALLLDPDNGDAYRLLAAGVFHQAYLGFIPWDRTATERVMSFARRAVVNEQADDYAHWMLALGHLMAAQHERALASLRRALQINPNFSLAYGSTGTVLAWAGMPEESIANNELALKINPSDPINHHRYFGLALAHYLAARYARALEYATMVVQLRPEWWLGNVVYAATLAQVGRSGEAEGARSLLQRLKPQMTVASLNDLPFGRSVDRDHLGDGLRKAGLPEN